MIDWRMIRPYWYLIILFIWPIYHLIAILINSIMYGEMPSFEFVGELASQPYVIPVVLILYFIQAGVEEPGLQYRIFSGVFIFGALLIVIVWILKERALKMDKIRPAQQV